MKSECLHVPLAASRALGGIWQALSLAAAATGKLSGRHGSDGSRCRCTGESLVGGVGYVVLFFLHRPAALLPQARSLTRSVHQSWKQEAGKATEAMGEKKVAAEIRRQAGAQDGVATREGMQKSGAACTHGMHDACRTSRPVRAGWVGDLGSAGYRGT